MFNQALPAKCLPVNKFKALVLNAFTFVFTSTNSITYIDVYPGISALNDTVIEN